MRTLQPPIAPPATPAPACPWLTGVPHGVPAELTRLLATMQPDTADEAWVDFIGAYSRLLLHVSRSMAGSHDDVMDRYAYLLEQLRRDDCRRLRAFTADGQSKFTSWLIVVARRLCVDYNRGRYGRADPARDAQWQTARAGRRRLQDLIGAELDVAVLPDADGQAPDDELIAREQREALARALTRLEPRDRLLLRFRFGEGLSASEIARVMGFPTQFHVYRRLEKVLGLLRRALEGREALNLLLWRLRSNTRGSRPIPGRPREQSGREAVGA